VEGVNMQMYYSVKTVTAVTGLTPRVQDYWVWNGYIAPSAPPTSLGSSGRRKWTFTDLVALQVMARLRDQVGTVALKKVATFLQSIGESFSNASLIVSGDDVLLAHSQDEIISILKKPGQTAFCLMVINLAEAEREVLAALQAA
jgi:DNA-binding transcriptional MerR regulator